MEREREHALKMFRMGKVSLLVATDVASRGLDIPNVMFVINYDLPNNIDAYVHRIGRTGRCGNNGNAISFVNETNKPVIKTLMQLLKESKSEIPQWFADLYYKFSSYNYSGYKNKYNKWGGHGGSSYGNKFGQGTLGINEEDTATIKGIPITMDTERATTSNTDNKTNITNNNKHRNNHGPITTIPISVTHGR